MTVNHATANANANNIVAKELSDALARCKQKGVDESSLRTGLLTITIANFVNRIGLQNSIALFQALPDQIASGIFDKYVDPNTNTNQMPLQQPAPSAVHPPTGQPQPTMGYQNGHMPQNFVPPSPTPAPMQFEHPPQAGMQNPLNNFGPMDGNMAYPDKRRRTD
ncbi:MAG: hypothetical protein JJ879_02065 [Sneathiella sp.]|nr:hypothetical protein [Sneathiella sp.]